MQRSHVEHRERRRAHHGPHAGLRPQRRPGQRLHARGPVGADEVHRRGALREDARHLRPGPHRRPRGRARPRLRHEARGLRPVLQPRARRTAGRDALRRRGRHRAARGLHHRAPAEDQADHRHVRARPVRAHEGRRDPGERRARRHLQRGLACRLPGCRQDRRRGA